MTLPLYLDTNLSRNIASDIPTPRKHGCRWLIRPSLLRYWHHFLWWTKQRIEVDRLKLMLWLVEVDMKVSSMNLQTVVVQAAGPLLLSEIYQEPEPQPFDGVFTGTHI
jgi:hypothetical protein